MGDVHRKCPSKTKAARAAKRELDAKNAAKEIEEFTNEFLSAARRFELIDKDGGGTLSTAEIVEAVKRCGSDRLPKPRRENLQFLLHPPRLKKARAASTAVRQIDARNVRPGVLLVMIDVHWLMCAQRRRSRRASRTAWSMSIERAPRTGQRESGRRILRGVPQRGPCRFLMIDKDDRASSTRKRSLRAASVLHLRVAAMARGRRPLIRHRRDALLTV